MAGISDKALKPNYTENKYRYNGGTELQNKEFSDGTGLEFYDANARIYDPQIGRFGGIDALSSTTLGLSPYQFAYNDPTLFNDPGGMKATPKDGYSQYSPAEQQYINGLADPMHHGEGWGEEFMAGGGGGSGSAGGSAGDGGGSAETIDGGFAFTGGAAQQVISDIQKAYKNTASNGNSFIDFGTDECGNVFDETYSEQDSYSNLGEEGNGYMDQTITFQRSTYAWIPAENTSGSYRIDGYAQISHQQFGDGKFVEWFLTIGVSGTTAAKLNGDTQWYGSTDLVVDGKTISSQNFEDRSINPESVYNSQSSFLGTTTFPLPITTSTVQAVLSVGYVLSNEQGRGGTPYPTQLQYTINVLH
ncbi:MAG TPA: RHS repeat-associated core domain-containing protein [Hanamia sp.]